MENESIVMPTIPSEIKEEGKLYYGVQDYPPADNVGVWKLVWTCTQEANACQITNGNSVGVYLISTSELLENQDNIKNHFDNPNNTPIIAKPNETFIFGNANKYLYKLVSKSLLDSKGNPIIETNNEGVENEADIMEGSIYQPLSARIIFGEDKYEQFKERVDTYKKEIAEINSSSLTQLPYLGMIQRYDPTNYRRAGKKRYFIGDKLSDWLSVDERITEHNPFWIKQISQLPYIKHDGIVVMNSTGKIIHENYNRSLENVVISDTKLTVMTRFSKRYIIHCEVYDGLDYFLVSAISNKPFKINILDALELTQITHIKLPFGIPNNTIADFNVNNQYNNDTGEITAWLASCCIDKDLGSEKEFFYIGTYANASNVGSQVRSFPYAELNSNVSTLQNNQGYITNWANTITAGSKAKWGVVTMDCMLASCIIPMRLLYNGLSMDKMPNNLENVTDRYSNSLGGNQTGNETDQNSSRFLHASSFILGLARMNGTHFNVTNDTNILNNARAFFGNKSIIVGAVDWRFCNRMFLINDPSLTPETELNLDNEPTTMQVGAKEIINVITNANDYTFAISNARIIAFNKTTKELSALTRGTATITFNAKALNNVETKSITLNITVN